MQYFFSQNFLRKHYLTLQPMPHLWAVLQNAPKWRPKVCVPKKRILLHLFLGFYKNIDISKCVDNRGTKVSIDLLVWKKDFFC